MIKLIFRDYWTKVIITSALTSIVLYINRGVGIETTKEFDLYTLLGMSVFYPIIYNLVSLIWKRRRDKLWKAD